MKTRAESSEVFYPEEDLVLFGRRDLDYLKAIAIKSPRRRARLCTHRNGADQLHEMFIVLHRETYVRPHKHLHQAESFFIIEGEVDLIIFDEQGSVTKIVPMGDWTSGKVAYFRLDLPFYHMALVRTECAIVHEVTLGPFDRNNTHFAPWSPAPEDDVNRSKFVRGLASTSS